MEVDEDRVETMELELDRVGGLWTARERFYIGDTEKIACVSDRIKQNNIDFLCVG